MISLNKPFEVGNRIELEDGTSAYAPVLFLESVESALIVGVTVYYDSSNPTERVKDDINTRVRGALLDNNIEIPYPRVEVVKKPETYNKRS